MAESYGDNYKHGYISLYRSIKDHWLFPKGKPLSQFEAWVVMLMEVNHKAKKVKIGNEIVHCKRGDSINSLETWAKLFHWNKSKVRRFIKLLESDSMLVQKPTHITTHITICNYDSYQTLRNADESQMKRKRNASETQVTPNNNVNNVNNENNVYRAFDHLKISIEDNKKILDIGYTQDQIDSIYDSIENFTQNKKYKNLFITAKNWLKREHGKPKKYGENPYTKLRIND